MQYKKFWTQNSSGNNPPSPPTPSREIWHIDNLAIIDDDRPYYPSMGQLKWTILGWPAPPSLYFSGNIRIDRVISQTETEMTFQARMGMTYLDLSKNFGTMRRGVAAFTAKATKTSGSMEVGTAKFSIGGTGQIININFSPSYSNSILYEFNTMGIMNEYLEGYPPKNNICRSYNIDRTKSDTIALTNLRSQSDTQVLFEGSMDIYGIRQVWKFNGIVRNATLNAQDSLIVGYGDYANTADKGILSNVRIRIEQ